MYGIQKKLSDFYRSIRFEFKYFWRHSSLCRKIQNYYERKRNLFYKKKYNFIDIRDFHEKFGGITIRNDFLGYGKDLFEIEDAYIGGIIEGAFIHKFKDNKRYTLNESAGKKLRLNTYKYKNPVKLNNKNIVEEDEICQTCFIKGNNYWHFTLEILPRIMIMEKSGYKGKYLVNSSHCGRDFLQLLSIPQERLIFSNEGLVIHAKKIFLLDEIFGASLNQKLLADLRSFVIEKAETKNGKLIDESYPKRLYVSRIGTRRIINEKEIEKYLTPLGFKFMIPEEYSVYEQIKHFANADIIVQPHGANCTNMLYSKSGTSFVECFGHRWINPCMIGTIIFLELDYRMVCERYVDNIADDSKFANYKINMDLFICTMKKVFEFREGKLPPVNQE